MKSFRADDLQIGDIDDDHEVEIIVRNGNSPRSVWINQGIAIEIINHLKDQFDLKEPNNEK